MEKDQKIEEEEEKNINLREELDRYKSQINRQVRLIGSNTLTK